MNWFVVLWTFFFGACLGSFLNVVAYRVPNRLTLLGSSRCPFCYVPIHSQHNLPIVGWFSLRGRCAACRLPIAPRYFIVEIIAGLLLVWLYRFELYSDGQNLPTDQAFEIGKFFRALSAGEYSELMQLKWGLVRNFFIHCLIAYTLLTAALMKLDGFQIPRVWAGIHLSIVAVTLMIWPTDFEFAGLMQFKIENDFVRRVEVPLVGGVFGALFGMLLSKLSTNRSSGLMFSFSLAGMCLGLFGTISLGAIFVVFASVTLFRSRIMTGSETQSGSRFLLFALLAAFLIQVGFWRLFFENKFWPNPNTSIWIGCGYVVFIIASVLVLMPRPETSENEPNDQDQETGSETDVNERSEIPKDVTSKELDWDSSS